jgi:hypothetical protein
VSAPESQEQASQPSALIISRVIPVVIVVAATVFAGVWRMPQTRLWVIDKVGPHQILNLNAALEDPDEAVAARACEITLTSQWSWKQVEAYRTLYKRPPVALACLEGVRSKMTSGNDKDKEEEATGSSRVEFSPVSRAQLAALRLGRQWMVDLHEGRANSCETASAARKALEFAEAEPAYPLLRCAVSASASEARQCCIDEMGGEDAFTKLLEQPDRVSLMRIDEHYDELVRAAFPAEPVAAKEEGEAQAQAEDEEESDAKQKADDQKADKQTKDAEKSDEALAAKKQDWVFNLGCRFHFEEPARMQVVSAFLPIIESPGCSPDTPPWQGYYNAQNWSMVCSGMYTERRTEQKKKPREALCDSLKYASIDEAIGVSMVGTDTALSRAEQEASAYEDQGLFGGGYFFSDGPTAPYVTSRQRRSRNVSSRASTASRQILGSMARQLFRR